MGSPPRPPAVETPQQAAESIRWSGAARGRPLVVVEGSCDGALPDRAEAPVVVIAVAHEPDQRLDGADVYLAESSGPLPAPWVRCRSLQRELTTLAARIEAHPYAAVCLAQVLRSTPHQSLEAAAVVESAVYGLLQAGADHRSWLAAQPSRTRGAARDPVRVARQGATLHVTLDRPERRNAYDAATRDALVDILDAATFDPSLTDVVVDGTGPCFCSGGDLAEFGTATDPSAAHGVRTTRHAGLALARSTPRTTARVHGTCVGAGTELPAFADRVVAAPGTTFRLPELDMGLIPGAGGTVSLPRRIGAARTAWLALAGTAIDVERALEWGLVDELED